MSPENTVKLPDSDLKRRVLSLLIGGFFKLHPNEVLNVMVVCHEVMTRFLGMENVQSMVSYLVSYEVMSKMFEVLKMKSSM